MAITSETSDIDSAKIREHKVFRIFDDKSVDEETSDEIDFRNFNSFVFGVEAGAGVASGVVEIEGAMRSGYTGIWKQLGSLTINAASKLFSVAVVDSPYPYIRARITTIIAGGTIDAYLALQR